MNLRSPLFILSEYNNLRLPTHRLAFSEHVPYKSSFRDSINKKKEL